MFDVTKNEEVGTEEKEEQLDKEVTLTEVSFVNNSPIFNNKYHQKGKLAEEYDNSVVNKLIC